MRIGKLRRKLAVILSEFGGEKVEPEQILSNYSAYSSGIFGVIGEFSWYLNVPPRHILFGVGSTTPMSEIVKYWEHGYKFYIKNEYFCPSKELRETAEQCAAPDENRRNA